VSFFFLRQPWTWVACEGAWELMGMLVVGCNWLIGRRLSSRLPRELSPTFVQRYVSTFSPAWTAVDPWRRHCTWNTLTSSSLTKPT
jgi:hypothetical protein